MARILLISCNTRADPYAVYPLGVAMVAEALRQRGHTAHVWDALAEPEATVEAVVARTHPAVIGLSVRNLGDGDSVRSRCCHADVCRDWVRRLRAVADAPIVLGGAGFSLLPEALMAHTGADYGVVGEGEVVFPELVERLASGERPGERLHRAAQALAPESIPTAAREGSLARHYLREGGMLNVQSQRGCPHRCAYCSYPTLEGARRRFRPVEAVVAEIEMLRDTVGMDYFAFADSVFNDDEGRWRILAEEMVRREIGVRWMAFFRPARFTREDALLLRRSGLACAEWGADGTSERTLAGLNKGFGWSEVERSIARLSEVGVANACFVIFGGPGETRASVAEGLANIARLPTCVVLPAVGVGIVPATEIHRIAVAEGVVAPDDDLLNPKLYFSPDVEADNVHDALGRAFGDRADRLYPQRTDPERARLLRQMGHRGPLWDLILRERPGGRR